MQSVSGNTNTFFKIYAKVAQLVEHYLAKVRVAGSSLVFRSKRSFYNSFFHLKRPGGGMVDTQDLKSCDHRGCAGSSPAPGTLLFSSTNFHFLSYDFNLPY